MSVEDLMIHFIYDDDTGEKQFYMPGDLLRGTIHLYLRRSLRVRNIVLMILGGAAVSWEELGKKKLYSSREEYLQGTKVLLDAGEEDAIELSRGRHGYYFEYQLPTHLPSTISGVYGSITYLAKVLMMPEDEHATTLTSEPFMVLRRPALPAHTFGEKEMNAKKLFCGLLDSGKIKMRCRISRSAAIPAEIIYVNAEVSNWSPRGITLLQGSVIMETIFYAQNSKNKKITFYQVLNKRIDVFDVHNLRGRRWRNVQFAIPPFLPDSGLEGCSVMDVNYFFEYRAQVEGRNDVVLKIPLYVGGDPDMPSDHPEGLGTAGLGRDFLAFTNNELPWYGGETMTDLESVDGDVF